MALLLHQSKLHCPTNALSNPSLHRWSSSVNGYMECLGIVILSLTCFLYSFSSSVLAASRWHRSSSHWIRSLCWCCFLSCSALFLKKCIKLIVWSYIKTLIMGSSKTWFKWDRDKYLMVKISSNLKSCWDICSWSISISLLVKNKSWFRLCYLIHSYHNIKLIPRCLMILFFVTWQPMQASQL